MSCVIVGISSPSSSKAVMHSADSRCQAWFLAQWRRSSVGERSIGKASTLEDSAVDLHEDSVDGISAASSPHCNLMRAYVVRGSIQVMRMR